MHRANTLVPTAAALCLACLTSPSTADVGDVSASVKVGQARVSAFDDLAGVSADEDTAFGVNVGYEFAPNWSAEAEYVSGEVEVTGPAGSLDVDVVSIAAYAAYRSSGAGYFVGRIGYVSLDLSAPEIPSETETGLSYGFGGGYRATPELSFELDYTIVEEDTDWLLVSARYHF